MSQACKCNISIDLDKNADDSRIEAFYKKLGNADELKGSHVDRKHNEITLFSMRLPNLDYQVDAFKTIAKEFTDVFEEINGTLLTESNTFRMASDETEDN
jgi:hypothetical protein